MIHYDHNHIIVIWFGKWSNSINTDFLLWSFRCLQWVKFPYLFHVFLLWSIPQGYIMEIGRGYDDMISYAKAVSVSTSYRRCWNLISSSWTVTHLPHRLCIVSSLYTSIYSVDTLLYLYALPIITSLYFFSSLCLSVTWALS